MAVGQLVGFVLALMFAWLWGIHVGRRWKARELEAQSRKDDTLVLVDLLARENSQLRDAIDEGTVLRGRKP